MEDVDAWVHIYTAMALGRVRALSHTQALPVPAPDAMLSNGVFHT